jgi:hypothetical protein
VDLAIAADLGTLQRLPKIIGHGKRPLPSALAWLLARSWLAGPGREQVACGAARSARSCCCCARRSAAALPCACAGPAMELALTAREVGGQEALQLGLVARCLPDQAALMEAVQQVAAGLAAKPPLALLGTKRIMLHSRCGLAPTCVLPRGFSCVLGRSPALAVQASSSHGLTGPSRRPPLRAGTTACRRGWTTSRPGTLGC